MKITCDPVKRAKTVKERGLDFEDAGEVFADLTIDFEDVRYPYPETRMISAGHLRGRMVIIVWTPRDGGRHIISMRKANAREQKYFGQRLSQG
jgi:uncharacterized DUF497 family protein